MKDIDFEILESIGLFYIDSLLFVDVVNKLNSCNVNVFMDIGVGKVVFKVGYVVLVDIYFMV